MARRKRKDESPDWVAPEFDEVAFMRREIEGARAAVATIIWAVVGAVIAFALFAVLPFLAFLGGIAVGFGLYFMLPLFGVQVDAFKRKDWIGHGITYFFSWLAFWILFLNPPFGDFTDPTIQGISVSPYTLPLFTGNLTCEAPAGGTVTIALDSNNSIFILFRASDNRGLANLSVTMTPGGGSPILLSPTSVSGSNQCAGHRSELYPSATYNATFPTSATTSYSVVITATDGVGRQAAVGFLIRV